MKALFLSHEKALLPGGGGQQVCSREYRAVLTAAGFDLVDVLYDTDRQWVARLRRKLRPRAYPPLIPRDYWDRVDKALRETRAEYVFCNLNNFIAVAPELRRIVGDKSRLVLLSHGLVSVDDAHALRIGRADYAHERFPCPSKARLGDALSVEMRGLPLFDHVFCLADFEVSICRWLGARSVSWWPRTIPQGRELDWRPQGNRVGLVGTLDHPPNLEGVHLFCRALARRGSGVLKLRLVTRSAAVARDLKSRYEFVDDLGPLEPYWELESEAATWSAYLHPIYCHAMGCSTKVATGLAWGLPVLTSRTGLRGYSWREGELPTAETPAELADLAVGMLDRRAAEVARGEVLKVTRSSPSVEDIASEFLSSLGAGQRSRLA